MAPLGASMMKLRPGKLADYNEIVDMFKDLIVTVYDGFEIGEDIFFHGTVQGWYKDNKDIVVCVNDSGEITGFSLGYVEDIGIVKPYYFGDVAYVKPKFRKGRSSYLLYNNVVEYSENLGLPLIAKAFVSEENKDKVDKIQARWGKPRFVEYHKGKDHG